MLCHVWLWWSSIPRSRLCRCKFFHPRKISKIFELIANSIFSRKATKLLMPFATISHSCSTVHVVKNGVQQNGQLNHGTKTLALQPVPTAVAMDTKRDQSFANVAKIKLPKNIVTIYANLLRPSPVLSRARLSAKKINPFSVGSCIWKNIAAQKISENCVA